MLKSTIYLFIEALIIGVLVVLSLQYAAGIPGPTNETPAVRLEQHILTPAAQP